MGPGRNVYTHVFLYGDENDPSRAKMANICRSSRSYTCVSKMNTYNI